MVLMQLDGLAEEIILDGEPARSGHVCPFQETCLCHWLSLMRIPWIFHVAEPFLMYLLLIEIFHSLFDGNGIFDRGGIQISHSHGVDIFLSLLLGLCLGFSYFGRFVSVIFPLSESPDGSSWYQYCQYQVFGTEDMQLVYEEGRQKHLDAVAQRDVR